MSLDARYDGMRILRDCIEELSEVMGELRGRVAMGTIERVDHTRTQLKILHEGAFKTELLKVYPAEDVLRPRPAPSPPRGPEELRP
jgi:hypothetical protein